MKPFYLLAIVWLLGGLPVVAQTEVLTVEQCRALALENSPLQRKKLYAESISALQIRNLQSNSLPKIQVGAQASWQSDVFGLPFSLPGSDIPQVPQDQYKLSLDVNQRIWDGGSDRHLRQQRALESDLAAAQVEVDVFTLRELVTDLFFKALLLQESEAVLVASQKDLEARLKQTEAAIVEGVALRTAADQIKIQLLKTAQQITGIKSDHQAIFEILAHWIGREKVDFTLQLPKMETEVSKSGAERPEYKLFALQQKGYQIGKDALALRAQPRFEAFAQGGIGRPNPFNFFETGFEPFLLVGLRAAWTPFDWGNKRREAQVFDLQMKNVETQQLFFDQRLKANLLKDEQDEAKWQAQLADDAAIIALQKDIIRRAEAQVSNGIMTTTDYLSQLNVLTQAELNRKNHEIQAIQAREIRKAKLGD